MILLDKFIKLFCVCVDELMDKRNPFTVARLLESLPVAPRESQRSCDQASTETFTAEGSQSAQQNTPVTVGDSNNEVIMYKKR